MRTLSTKLTILAAAAALTLPVMTARAEDAAKPGDGKSDAPATTAPTTQGAVLQATDIDALKAAEGKEVSVRGKVSGSYKSGNSGVILLNFEGATRDFVAVVEKDNVEAVNAGFEGDVAGNLKGRTITITGPIKMYRGKPEVVITKPEQVKIEADEAKTPEADNSAPRQ
jgi:hypothetical protein